jgi:hypothetical protein
MCNVLQIATTRTAPTGDTVFQVQRLSRKISFWLVIDLIAHQLPSQVKATSAH